MENLKDKQADQGNISVLEESELDLVSGGKGAGHTGCCPDCGSLLIYRDGEFVCPHCTS